MANLTQLKILEDLSGLVLIDKPAGISFSTVVKTVKRKFNLVKVGHGGSLDAACSGLFILLLNDANRFTADIMGADRSYEGTMRLGVSTNTHDVHGQVVEEKGPCPNFEKRKADVISEFRGDVFQTESRWCSIRRDGSASYDIADTGEHKPFLTHVYRFDVAPLAQGANSVAFSVTGTKGLIVRTLVSDFGSAVGCGAALESLRRLRVGHWCVDDAIAFDKLLQAEMGDLPSLVKPFSRFA